MCSRHQHIKSIFVSVLDMESVDREAYLDEHCGEDAEMRAEVMELLGLGQKAGNYMAVPTGAPMGTVDVPLHDSEPQVIGSYKIREQLGEGGMGVVYVADQNQPIRRKVALKIIKPGMDSKQVISRFEAERQALAMMDHPNIAKVLDAGTTEGGRPYFVMELVRGIPITELLRSTETEHARATRIVRQRVSGGAARSPKGNHPPRPEAIERAGDLARRGASAKVIDFGIAKATNQQLTEQTVFTQFSQIVGTPLYMSPEQAQLLGTGHRYS